MKFRWIVVALAAGLAGCTSTESDEAGARNAADTPASVPTASRPVAPDNSGAAGVEITGVSGGDGTDPVLPGVGNGGYDVIHYDLDLTLDIERGELAAVATIEIIPTVDLDRFQFDLVGFDLAGDVLVDGLAAPTARDGRELVIDPHDVLASGAPATIEISYEGAPQTIRDATAIPVGLFFRPWGAFVVAEPHGAAGWFPANDHPTDKATFAITLTTDSDLLSLAPGRLVAEEDLADGQKRRSWSSDAPMATYLAWILVGDLDQVDGPDVDGVGIRHVVPRGDRSLIDDLSVTESMLTSFVEWFGPFPFAEYGSAILPDDDLVPAMENQTLPVYARWVFSSAAPDHFGVRTQAHELAHQWFGNHVSPGQWGDTWLNEGFASWAEIRWLELNVENPPLTFESISQEAVYGPIVALASDELFDRRVYRRGALTVEALRRRVGDDRFFGLLRTWVDRFGGGTATTDDFLALVEEELGADEATLVTRWLEDPSQPLLPPPAE